MRHHSFAIVTFFVCQFAAAPALAGNESWVAANGTNTGTCPITAPCRTFQFAHDQTNNNGAINILTAGNFGPLTITKPISIVAQGVEAVINTAASGAAITVQAGGGAVVSLRGLTIDLRGTDNDGIVFVSGAALHVRNCVICRTRVGIRHFPDSGTHELYVADTTIADSTGTGLEIDLIGPANVNAVIDRVRVENSSVNGMSILGNIAAGTLKATVRDSVSTGNGNNGIVASHSTAGSTAVMVDRVTSVNNGTGIFVVGGNAKIRIGNSTVTGNVTGLSADSGGTIDSYETNKVDGNGTDGSPTNTILEK